MRLSPQSVLLSCLLLAAAPDGASAQGSVFDGGSFERILGSGGQAVAFTYRRTEVSERGFGLDLAIGIFPAALGYRTVRLQVDAGFAATQAIGPAALVLKAGVGSLMDLGLSTQLIPGLQAGVAAIIPLERRCALRLDLTRRQLFPDGEPVALWSLGVGLTVRSRGRPASGR
jgi:hypothetical protein